MNKSLIKSSFLVVIFVSLAIDAQGQQLRCRPSQWQCADGYCIDYGEQCDGIVNCPDGSDETISSCSTIACANGFRCAYGGCVNKGAECNGVRDCADNSDEITVNCPGALSSFTPKGNCSNYEFQCKSGECLPFDQLCDGIGNCRDNSDETAERCISTHCPSFGYRCAYGACINSYKKCDGTMDCIDGSDEISSACGPIPQKPIENTSPPSIIFTPDENDQSCILREIPENGIVVFEYNPAIQLHLNDRVEQFQGIVYKCNDSPDTKRNYCQNGEWIIRKTPVCKKYCSGLQLQHPTIQTRCEYNSQSILCGAVLNPTTVATISCEFGYRKPDNFVKSNIHCLPNGKWDYLPYQCEQVCGTGPERGVEYSFGGVLTNITEVPWHAAIYDKIHVPGNWTQVCGGTILSSNLILTAAHCFWDETEKSIYNENYIYVGVGKSRRDFNEKERLQVQLIGVRKIFTNPQYSHAEGLYLADIAFLLLETHIVFKFYIKPICLEFNLINSELSIPTGTVGTVAGWGVDETGLSSEDLKVIEIPYIDYATCKDSASESYKNYIQSDKFCGGYLNMGLSVCRGDSGGGWVYPKEIDGVTKFYLRGIVSNGENLQNSCDPNKYSSFTSVEFYFPWILEKLAQYSPNVMLNTNE